MPVVTCRNCRVANPDEQALCHCCGAKLPGAGKASLHGGNAHPIEEHFRRLEQERESKVASRCLLGAAFVLLIRGTAYPLLLSQLPYEMLKGIDPQMVRMLSYFAAASIFAMFMLARTHPLSAALIATGIYVTICIPDLANGQTWLGKGIISKAIMAGPLGRALIAGMLHWLHEPTIHRGPIAEPPPHRSLEPMTESVAAPVAQTIAEPVTQGV